MKGATGRRMLGAVLVVLAGAGAGLVAMLVTRAGDAAGPPAGRVLAAPSLAPALPDQPNVVHRPGGITLLCPNGSTPAVLIENAHFVPALDSGTSFRAGRYRISLRGRVANETTAAIELRSIDVTLDGRPWHATVRVDHRVPAQGSVPLRIEGSFDSASTERAAITTRLHWQWQSPTLRPCGEEGLIDDD